MAGLDSSGFNVKRFVEIQESLNSRFQSSFGEDINLDDDSVIAQIRDIFALEVSDLWELGQAIDSSFKPSSAEGQQLDDNCSLVGVRRLPATRSETLVQFYGTNGTVIPINSLVSVSTSKEIFQTIAASSIDNNSANRVVINIDTVTSSVTYTVTVDGVPFAINSGGGATNTSIAAALVAALNINSQGLLATDNGSGVLTVVGTDTTVSYDFTLDIKMSFTKVGSLINTESVNYGPIAAPAGILNTIVTSIAGLDMVTNPADAVLGTNEESDTALRLRRNLTLSNPGAGTLDSMISGVNELADVTYSFGRENTTNATDGFGLPQKSFQIIVEGGDDDEIAQVIWDRKPAGILSYGGDSGTAVDIMGNDQTVDFQRPTAVPIYVLAEYTLYSEEIFPTGGKALIEAIILEEGAKLAVGTNVISQRFHGPIFSQVAGIETLTIKIKTSPTPTLTTTIAISDSQRATFAAVNITSSP